MQTWASRGCDFEAGAGYCASLTDVICSHGCEFRYFSVGWMFHMVVVINTCEKKNGPIWVVLFYVIDGPVV